VLEALRAHRQRQRLERIAAGAGGWATTMPLRTGRGIQLVDNDLVFTTTSGQPTSGSYIDAGPFREVCRTAGIAYSARERKGLRFHDLRHSTASIMAARGERPEVIQRVMRHAKVSFTIDRYVKVYRDDVRDAVQRSDRRTTA